MNEPFDRLLRDTLRERLTSSTPGVQCLDPDTAGAFADNRLEPADRAAAQVHVAECARCQSLLASIARITPAPLARPWWRRPSVGWLAPLTACAAGLIVWVTVSNEPQMIRAPLASLESAPVPGNDTMGAPPALPQERPSPQISPPAASPGPAAREIRQRAAANSVSKTPARQSVGDVHARALPVEPGATPAAPEIHEEASAPAAAGSAPAGPPPSPAAAARETSEPPPAEPSFRALTETAAMTAEAKRMSLDRVDISREREIISSNPIARWRIGAQGLVRHSADGGRTWHARRTGLNVTMTAGSSPAPAICWLVGPAGLVLVSSDEGRSWQRLTFPEAVDLIGVRATDHDTASVLTSDGRMFMTSDRGAHWEQQ